MRWRGPVEWVAIEFDGGQLDPRLVPPLAALVDAGTVRLLDAAVVHKEADGRVRGTELADEMIAFDPVPGEVLELLSEEDLRRIAEDIPVGSTSLVLVGEPVGRCLREGGPDEAQRAAHRRMLTDDEFAAQKARLLGS
jgi:hypothetical protein